MKRIVLGLMTTVTVLVLLFGYHTSTSSSLGKTVLAAPVRGGSSTGTGGSAGAGSPPSGATAAPAAPGATRTVTGSSVDTRWGPVQVQLTVADRKITDVAVVEYPNGNRRDQVINAQALPILVQETLGAQSAHIDMVSGATVTSEGYVNSLQSALDKAGL